LYIFDLGETVTLAEAGGRGLNLHLLAGAGFNVPSGFIIATSTYKEYMASNNLQRVIEESIDEITDDIDSLHARAD
jgi:phosphoenolpyruvate synthase/pyruvate phosphate dikinase